MQQPLQSIPLLIVSHIRGELDSAGQEQLNEWLTKEENKATFNRITDVQYLHDGLAITHENRLRRELLKRKIDRAIYKKPAIIKSLKYTAAAIIAGVLIAAAYFTFNTKENNQLADTYNLMHWLQNRALPLVFYNSVSTNYGGQTRLVLPDNSVVHLNSRSGIRYAVDPTSWKRTVELSGEGMFEVENSNQPFVVSVNDATGKRRATFEVLGTTFNLNAYYDEDVIKATLLNGIIKIHMAGSDQMLAPGQQALIGPAGVISITSVNVQDEIAWQQGKLRYHNANIRSVMRMVSRQYGVKAVFDQVKQEGYNGVISNSLTLQEALDLLELTTEYHFTIKGDLVTVRSKGLQR